MEEQEEIYEVEAILSKRMMDGEMHYKIKWKDYPLEECTYEPLSNLDTALNLVQEFE